MRYDIYIYIYIYIYTYVCVCVCVCVCVIRQLKVNWNQLMTRSVHLVWSFSRTYIRVCITMHSSENVKNVFLHVRLELFAANFYTTYSHT